MLDCLPLAVPCVPLVLVLYPILNTHVSSNLLKIHTWVMNLSGSSKSGMDIFSRVMIFLLKIRPPYFRGWAHFWERAHFWEITVYVAVPCRNWRLFGWIFWSHCCLRVPYRWTSVKGGAHMCFMDLSDIHASMKHVWAPPWTKVQRYSTSNPAMRSKYVTE